MLISPIAICGFALGLVLTGGSLAQSQRRPQQMGIKQPTTTISQEKSHEEQRGTEKSPLIVKVAPAQKTDTERADETKERERMAEAERNKIKADSDIVKYTGELASFTRYLFYATVALGIATIGLLVAAYFQSRDTKRAIIAAERSADAAKEAVTLSDKTAKLQLRAYVHVADVNILYMDSEWCPNIRIRVKNYGQTPAYKVSNRSGHMMALIGEPVFSLPETIARFSDLGPSQD